MSLTLKNALVYVTVPPVSYVSLSRNNIKYWNPSVLVSVDTSMLACFRRFAMYRCRSNPVVFCRAPAIILGLPLTIASPDWRRSTTPEPRGGSLIEQFTCSGTICVSFQSLRPPRVCLQAVIWNPHLLCFLVTGLCVWLAHRMTV